MTTLLLCVLLSGLALATQARALAQARLLARVADGHRERVSWQSARALALPVIGESLLATQDGETVPPFSLDGAANEVEADGRTWEVRVAPADRREWVTVRGTLQGE